MIETIKVAAQWLFTPLLVIVVLAWLCLRIEASGTFGAIRDIVRKMSVFQRFAAAAFLAVFIVFAGEKTNSPPANLPPTILPSVPPLLPEPPRSGESEVTNLCFTSISVVSNETMLGISWPLDFIGSDSKIDLFAFASLDAAEVIQGKINTWEGNEAEQYQIVPVDLSSFDGIANP